MKRSSSNIGFSTYDPEQIMKQLCEDTDASILGYEFMEYEANLEKSQQELELLLNLDLDKHAEAITFDQLCVITFNKAKVVICKMTIQKRISMLKPLQNRLDHLYEGTKGYYDSMFGSPVSPKVFQQMMGKIKHMEILMSWLYGIE